jgi:hypothetical protein
MKEVRNFTECLEYVNRLGIVHPLKPFGWRQQDLCAIVATLEVMADMSSSVARVFRCRHSLPGDNSAYPFKVRFLRARSIESPHLHFAIEVGKNSRIMSMEYPRV